jgi:hypothetical protein
MLHIISRIWLGLLGQVVVYMGKGGRMHAHASSQMFSIDRCSIPANIALEVSCYYGLLESVSSRSFIVSIGRSSSVVVTARA